MKEDHRHLSWETRERRKLQDCRIFTVYSVDRESFHGDTGSFIQIDAPDWVTVIPLLEEGQGKSSFLMVNQYRHGNEMITREFPAGIVEEGEPEERAAYRELLEETGYEAGELIQLGSVSPNPAFMRNRVTTFLARDLKQVQEQSLDEFEIIDVVPVPVDQVIPQMGSGIYDNGIMMISLLHYLKWAGMIGRN